MAREYVELHCHSAYSFLDGASLPEELAVQALELGYGALALTDHDGVYGSLEFAHAAKALGLRAITGAEVTLRTEGLVCLSGCARRGLAVLDPNAAARLAAAFGRDRFYVELQRPYLRGDARRNAALRELAATLGVPTVATGNVHAHAPSRARLQDVLV